MCKSLKEIECVLPAQALLGESPVWRHEDQALYWVDIKRPAVHRFDAATGGCRTWPMPEDIGSVVLRESGGAMGALRSGFATIDFSNGEVRKFGTLNFAKPEMRFNDGRCDRRGRFWAGTLHENRVPGTAALYRLDPTGACVEVLGGLTVSNGIAWSLDSRTMYFADSWAKTIFQCDFDLDSGTLGQPRVFAEVPPGAGVPDGATVDGEGCLWSANFDGGCVTRYAPSGSVDRIIRLPVQRPTSCTFGGEDYGVLYVTSASLHLTDEQRKAAPWAGGVFAVDAGVKGVPEPRFAG